MDVPDLVLSNIGFPTRLAQALAGSGCRFVNPGSAWQHHDGRAYGPASLYAATKQTLQDILQFYGECVGIDVVNVKLCDTYGPADQRGKLVDLLLRTAREQAPLALTGSEQLIDLVHVADAVEALEAAALAPSQGAPTSYCVSSGEAISIRELVDCIENPSSACRSTSVGVSGPTGSARCSFPGWSIRSSLDGRLAFPSRTGFVRSGTRPGVLPFGPAPVSARLTTAITSLVAYAATAAWMARRLGMALGIPVAHLMTGSFRPVPTLEKVT